MAHGLPDWGITAGATTIYKWADRDELAARLKSIVTYDRRGDVAALEDFESGAALWSFGGLPSGWSGYLSAQRARSGSFSAYMAAKAFAADATATLIRYFPQVATSAIGLEFSIARSALADFDLTAVFYTGGIAYEFAVRRQNTNGLLQVLDETGSWVTVESGVSLFASDKLMHTVKLVADPLTGRYVRLLLNSAAYDLSDVEMQQWASGVVGHVWVRIKLVNTRADVCYAWIDDVIVTQNEPT